MPPKNKGIASESILEFIRGTGSTNGIKNENNFENILDSIKYIDLDTNGDEEKDRSTTGYYYERLWDLCIKFGLTDLTTKKTIHVIKQNTNIDDVPNNENSWGITGFEEYLNSSVRSGSEGGYSDITFLNKKDNGEEELYFISVKYFKKEKPIDKYDIPKLCVLTEKHRLSNRKVNIFIFIKDKKEAINVFKNQNISSNLLLDKINPHGNYENIYGVEELHKYYFKLRELLSQYNYFKNKEDIQLFKIQYLEGVQKPPFIPRFHQKLFIDKIEELNNQNSNNILVGAIPRSGKSYIMAGCILEYVKNKFKNKYFNFLMITPAPNETFSEYIDVFNHIDFDKNKIIIHTIKDGIIFNKDELNKDQHNVIIISKQSLGWGDVEKSDEHMEKLNKIKENIIKKVGPIINKLNLMLLDEAHFGMSTQKSMEILKILEEFGKVQKIYVTATYNKPLQIYNISEDRKLTWDLSDINTMKKLNKSNITKNVIRDRFGHKIYDNALEYFGDKSGESHVDIFVENYSIYPTPYMITSIWDLDKIKIEKTKIMNTDYGFDMDKLFMTKDKQFNNANSIISILRYYFGKPSDEMDYDEGGFYMKEGILPRIRNICSGNCRTLQDSNKLTTQLWFIPANSEGKIEDKAIALVDIITKYFKDQNYHYYIAINVKGKNKLDKSNKYVTYLDNSKNIKKEITDLEKRLQLPNKNEMGRDLIIISGNRLQLGISLRSVDIVAMFNNIKSSDKIFQMLFRCMTEVNSIDCNDGGYCDKKKYGFMVDMNPQRCMTNMNIFGDNITYMGKDVKEQYKQISDLINIDNDKLIQRHGDNPSNKEIEDFSMDLINKLSEYWKADLQSIKKVTENFNYNNELLMSIEKNLRNIGLSSEAKLLNDKIIEPDIEIEPGAKKEKLTKKEKEKLQKDKVEAKEIPIEELAAELMTELISLLNIFTLYLDGKINCLLTSNDNINESITIDSTILKLFDKVIKSDQKDIFLKVLNGRLGFDENKPFESEPYTIINTVIESVFNQTDKSKLSKVIYDQKKHYHTIKEPEKLLEYINDNLKPKAKERKDFGEVFTSIQLVIDMLNILPPEVWMDPTLKWLDPAVGIGNFPIIIYLKLMEGLKTPINDVKYPELMKNIDISTDEKKRKHILENMLYMIDISDKNIYILNKVLCGQTETHSDGYKLNIYKESFIPHLILKEFNIDLKFDIVVGNPPYQGTGTKKIYFTFVEKILKKYLVINGYLLFITPKNILKYLLGRNINEHMIDKLYNIIYFNSNDDIKSKYFKDIGSDFCYYLIQNANYVGKTDVVFNDGSEKNMELKWNTEINLKSIDQSSFKIIYKVLNFDHTKKLWERYASRIEDKKDKQGNVTKHLFDKYSEEHPNKIVFKILTDADKIKSGNDVIYKWSDKTHKNTFKYKVLYPTLGNNPLIDADKNLFPGTSFVPYVLCDNLNECKFIVELTKSKLMKYIKENYPTRNIVDVALKNLIKYDKIIPGNITEKVIYDYFGINKTEQKLIEEIDINVHKNIPKSETKKTFKKPNEKPKPKKKKLVNTVSVPSNLFKTPESIKTFKKRNDPKNNGKQQIYNEKTGRWNTDTKANRKKILTQKK